MTEEAQSNRQESRRTVGLLALAIAAGLAIAWLDSRQGWDDTGITAGLILLASGVFTALRPTRPWLWAVAVGCWIPLLGILSTANYGSLLALAVAFLGAYTAALVVKTIRLFR